MVAIPLVLIHSVLQTKTTEIIDSLEMAAVKFLNAITERGAAGAMKIEGKPSRGSSDDLPPFPVAPVPRRA
jgi:hypothetical protein